MKIECDKCSAKYSIADEKVRGKTFKIRCKKCGNVIIVRDQAASASAEAEPSEDSGDPGWHLAINGETVGPMAEVDVRARYLAGEIDKETAVWQEGFEDWVPLADVEAFGDLPEAPSAAMDSRDEEDDPFASANQEDYAAAASVGGGLGSAAGAPSGESPRVSGSNLTGQRNENSVLFSLDSLQSMASTGPSASPAAAAGSNQQVGTKGLATAAPGSEGSGLIDIRALGAMVAPAQGGATAASTPAGADDAALPSFGGTGLGGLAAAPLVGAGSPEPAAAAAAAPPPPSRSNAPIYVLMAMLIAALGGLVFYILTRKGGETTIIREVASAPSVSDAKADNDDETVKDKDRDDDEKREEDTDESTPAADKSGKPASRKSGRRSGGKSGGGKKPGAVAAGSDAPSPAPKPAAKPSGGGSKDVSVDCILDPSKCKKSGKAAKAPAPVDPNLPETLSNTDIRGAVSPHKAAAKSCGSKHGAAGGTKVEVKLSISGSTGTVSSSTAQGAHKGTPLGNCVAAALKKAKFKKFRKPVLGVVYPIRL